ncbi:hypothetical protein [Phenylobacterium sp.]|uniref:hypothetical protein n=1 Tax=Phenylobacterium sp. TaxID=1871053 RepID=UPI002ED97067
MSAVACLRVDVSGECAQMPPEVLAPLVQKFASAYLETRWSWPRRFSPFTAFCFLLIDPRSDELDLGELRRLSDELQRHLFGTGDEGEVALLVFEGHQAAVTAFATLDAKTVAAAVKDPSLLPPGGRLTRIVAEWREPAGAPAAVAADPEWAPDDDSALRRELTAAPPAAAPAWEGFQGIYFTPRELFYGDVVMCVPANARTHLSLVDGPEHMPRDAVAFDEACLKIAVRMLTERPRGSLLFLPMCYSSLVRPSMRDAYQAMLMELPSGRRAELAASVYDVPRDPAFTGLRQVRALLAPYVSAIDLRITDPGFEIEKLPPEAANSVTLMLPEGDAHQRTSALRRFAERLVHYKQRRIWPGVTNVRRSSELETASRLRIPFVTGPAVCAPVPAPVGGRAVALTNLPLSLRETWVPRPQIA